MNMSFLVKYACKVVKLLDIICIWARINSNQLSMNPTPRPISLVNLITQSRVNKGSDFIGSDHCKLLDYLSGCATNIIPRLSLGC